MENKTIIPDNSFNDNIYDYSNQSDENLKKFSPEKIATETKNYLKKVFMWMFAGVFVSAVSSYFTYIEFIKLDDSIKIKFLVPIVVGAIIAQLILAIALSWLIKKMSKDVARVLFIAYSILTGVSFSTIFFAFSISTIIITLFSTSIMFLVLSIIGYKTNKDISKFGTILFAGLICLIVVGLVNLFIGSNMVNFIASVIGVFVFMGFTIFDVYSIKRFNKIGNEGTDEDEKEVVIGAFNLYLDFVNLFLNLLKVIAEIVGDGN